MALSATASSTIPHHMTEEELVAHLAAIVESSDDAIISKALDGTILSWNRGAERLYGYTPAEAIGQPIYLIVPDDLHDEVRRLLATVASGQRVEHHDTRRRCKDGSTVEISLTISPVRNLDGEIASASVIARDVTERKRLERRLVQLAGEDQLTGLANRRMFLRQLEQHVDRCGRYGWSGGVLVLDIDRFKAINDTLGHGAGDHLIKQSAARLRRRLRSTDVVARLGGDEFAVLAPDGGALQLAGLAKAIVDEFAGQEIAIGGRRCATTSVGWMVLDSSCTAEEAIVRADLALYEAKGRGGHCASGYSSERDTRLAPSPIDASLLLAETAS